MKTSKIKNLILIISIIFIVNIISIGTVNATQKAWDKTEAKTERIQISRYILANENQKTKSKYPSWTILTTNEISKLDKNGDKKVDKNDLIKVKRHILAMENSTKKREHPDWIIYEEIVGESIELDKTTLTLENGKKGTLKATITSGSTTDNSITWSSTNTAVATVDSEGNVTAKKAGTATIIAKTKSGKKASCKVTVEEPVAGIKLNKTTITMDNKRATILGVTITPTNATNKTVTWSSSNTSIATVEKNGRVTAKKEGTATITVKSSNGKTATCKVTVEEPVTSIKMNKTTLALDNQKTETLKTTITPTNATNKTVTWSSSNEAVATVDKNGKVTAKKAGIATITAKASNGKATSCKVTVEEPVTSIKLNKTSTVIYMGSSETLKVTINPTNATNKTVTWSSSDTTVATVDRNGKVTPKKEGTTKITVKSSNGKTAVCTVTVNTKITNIKLDRTVLMLDKDHYNFAELTAKLTPNKKVTIEWSSSNTKVATVDKNGKVTGKKYGTTKITATVKNADGTSVKSTCNVRVISSAKDSSVGKKYTYGSTVYLIDDNWTDEEVESYINNAAMILKKYPNKYQEGKEINVRYYYGGTPINSFVKPSSGDSRLYTYPYGRSQQNVVKPKGQLDINGYVLFFSTKKQWIYLLKKDSKGTFKMVKKERSSGGPNYGSEFDTFLAGIHTSTELGTNNKTDMHAIYRMGGGSNSLYANSVHLRRHSRIPNKSRMYTYN